MIIMTITVIIIIITQTSSVSVAAASFSFTMFINSDRTSGLRAYFPVHILLMESRKAT